LQFYTRLVVVVVVMIMVMIVIVVVLMVVIMIVRHCADNPKVKASLRERLAITEGGGAAMFHVVFV
jgi:heme/copper-type cytochrome/quinol oxidase subunit 2